MKIAILGAGAWGTALAINLSAKHTVHLWARDPVQVAQMQSTRCNQRYLPAYPLPAGVMVMADFSAAHTAEKFLRPIRAGAVETVSLLMVDALHFKAAV